MVNQITRIMCDLICFWGIAVNRRSFLCSKFACFGSAITVIHAGELLADLLGSLPSIRNFLLDSANNCFRAIHTRESWSKQTIWIVHAIIQRQLKVAVIIFVGRRVARCQQSIHTCGRVNRQIFVFELVSHLLLFLKKLFVDLSLSNSCALAVKGKVRSALALCASGGARKNLRREGRSQRARASRSTGRVGRLSGSRNHVMDHRGYFMIIQADRTWRRRMCTLSSAFTLLNCRGYQRVSFHNRVAFRLQRRHVAD